MERNKQIEEVINFLQGKQVGLSVAEINGVTNILDGLKDKEKDTVKDNDSKAKKS